MTADGRARIEVVPKGDANDNKTLKRFVSAVLAVAPEATGDPILIQESANAVVRAFLEAGGLALASITLILFVVLRRLSDVLVTLVPLLLAGVVTMELTVLVGLPLNFANIIALPLLLGVGVAFKIYYVLAWRSGVTQPARLLADAGGDVQRHDDGDGLRQPVVLQPPGDVEHGRAVEPVAPHHAGGGRAVPADPDGPAARAAAPKA